MKTTRRIATLLLALVMILSLATVAFAATVDQKVTDTTDNASITVTLPTYEAGATASNTYKIYKVFDATVNDGKISYTLSGSHTTVPAGFKLENGYVTYDGSGDTLTQANIDAIASYVTEADLVATVTTTQADTTFTVNNLPYGYYYITTTTGSLVIVNSTNPNANVSDKNTVPTLDKDITKIGDTTANLSEESEAALAEVGTKVTYTATITVAKGAKNYVFHDTMGTGLTYNNDVTVSGVEADKYTVKATPDDGDTITIEFTDGIAENTVITITYTATVNSDALTYGSENGKNTAYISYGDSNKTTSDTTELYNAKISVYKQDNSNQPLAGAGFVLKNSSGKYYKKNTDGTISWVDSIDDADEHKSGNDGNVSAFTGLANGTYTLVEKTVPDGYNKATDIDITIDNNNVTAENLAKSATVTNNAGSTLPSTGGIGTTIFYIVGGLLVAGAVILLVTKKRMSAEQ